jgi:hypothetical protein
MADDTQIPPDEDNSVLEAVEGDPYRTAKPSPGAFTEDQEQTDPEDAE